MTKLSNFILTFCSYNKHFQSWKDKPRYTLDYAPPELLTDPNVVTYSPAVDVYGLGATLYTMLVGHAPYRQSRVDCEHTPEVHHKLRKRMEKESFNQRPRIWQNASPQFKKLVTSCLQRDPAKRPQLSDILASDWVQQNNDPDVDVIPPPPQVVVDLSEDTMETPAEVLAKQEMPPPKPVATRASVSLEKHVAEQQVLATAEPMATIEDEEFVVQGVFDPDFEALTDFLGFDENVPPLCLPSEYFAELPLPPPQPRQATQMPPPAPPRPVPAPLTLDVEKRPRTRQQRRTELRQTAGTPPEPEDSKAGLYILMQQLAPPVEELPVAAKIRRLPPRPQSPRPLDDLLGFGKTQATWRKSRASWRHFCLLLNGVQQVLKHRFKKQRRVYCLPSIKSELLDEAYERPLIFPRPKPPAQPRVKRPPKVPRPPTRVQPERARALRQRYVFE